MSRFQFFCSCQYISALKSFSPFFVEHFYPPVTRSCLTLNIGRSAHFSLQWLLRAWRNPHLLRSFQWSNVSVNFFEFLSTEFARFFTIPLVKTKKKRKVFSSGISTNSGFRFKILAIFHEFLSEDQNKTKKRSSSQNFYEIRCESTKLRKFGRKTPIWES